MIGDGAPAATYSAERVSAVPVKATWAVASTGGNAAGPRWLLPWWLLAPVDVVTQQDLLGPSGLMLPVQAASASRATCSAKQELQRQPRPKCGRRNVREVLGVDGHVDVRRVDGD